MPVIAERELVRTGTAVPITIRIHQPEPLAGAPADPALGWRCGFTFVGLPEVWGLYDPPMELNDDEVLFAYGEDSFHALASAMRDIRGMLEHAEAELETEFTWGPRADWGHMVPRFVTQTYGRRWEQRLIDVLAEEEDRLMAARTPNPYVWDDPRHWRHTGRRPPRQP